MKSHPEQRENRRFPHEAAIMYENYPTGKYYEGRMLNYSRGGLYFESDFAPPIGTEIFIGIENSPYSAGHDVYRAKVVWHKKLGEKESFYYYGIGVRYF